MGRTIKVILLIAGGFIALFVMAAIALYLFFDPNDFREDIAQSVKEATGRELVIDGDISLDLFPWLAVEVGSASLGNAPGFGDEPMASFERASFSARLLPAIFSQELVVGGADIEGLQLNLVIANDGRSNWSDLLSEETLDESDAEADLAGARIDINSIEISEALIRYTNNEAGEVIILDGVNLGIGRLKSDGTPVPIDAELSYDVQPAGLSGNVTVDTTLSLEADRGMLILSNLSVDGVVTGVASIPTSMSLQTDEIAVTTAESRVVMQPLEMTMLDMQIRADVQPFTYDDRITPTATLAIDAFSPRSVMTLFDVEPPVTADPVALSRLIVDATAQLTTSAIELRDVDIKLDDTTFTGSLSVPRLSSGFYEFDLKGDSIQLANYMEPASEGAEASSEGAVPVEIPVDLIRPLKMRGKVLLDNALLGDIVFEQVQLGLNSSNGKMRLFPVSSQLFGGSYNGDVRIDVSGNTPALSLNEKIDGVDLARLAKAMFDQENVTGSIKGSFALNGRGDDTDAIQRSLAGNMALELLDGTYVGTDIWYELRNARARLKGETPPDPVLPAKTEFSAVRMTGVVSNGVMRSDDLFAELPFMQLTGAGQLDIPSTQVDYSLTAKVFERPELIRDATPEEVAEFSNTEIPLKITGPISSPSIQPDLEKLLRNKVEEEIKDKLKDKLKDLFD